MPDACIQIIKKYAFYASIKQISIDPRKIASFRL